MTKHKLSLRKTRDGCMSHEQTPRYDVLLNGVKIGQLYFNQHGYCGPLLPAPDGAKWDVGESSIPVWRSHIAGINNGKIR